MDIRSFKDFCETTPDKTPCSESAKGTVTKIENNLTHPIDHVAYKGDWPKLANNILLYSDRYYSYPCKCLQ